jgi:purine nucleosidase
MDMNGEDGLMPTPVVLDCDPGHDDAIAILLAAGAPEIDLRAITTVAANQTLDKVTLNAQRICSAAGISVPIARGCARPLVRPLYVAEDIHGESGMDGPAFGAISVDVLEGHAIDVDPEAAQIVFSSGVPVTMIGLNVTHQALVTPAVVARLNALGSLGRICGDLMTFFAATYREVFGFAAPPLHDPVAVARVIDPSLVTCVEAYVGIETTGVLTRGATVVDLHGRLGREPNAKVAVGLDVDRFFDRVIDAVGRLV